MTTKIRRLDDSVPLMRAHEPFASPERDAGDIRIERMSSMSGHRGKTTRGALPASLYDVLESAEYVVLSYRTPIAWWSPFPHDVAEHPVEWLTYEDIGEWVVPDVKYSLTTNNHQSLVESALAGRWVTWNRETKSWERHTSEPFARIWRPSAANVPCSTGRRDGW